MGQQTRLLVVGGEGFIGGHVVERALTLDWQVVSISLSNNVESLNKNLIYKTADLTKPKDLERKLHQHHFDYIVNCSGYIDHELFFNGGFDVINNHFLGLMNLLKVINRSSLKKFINIGSSDEYGNNKSPQNELQIEFPFSPYSFAKTAQTRLLRMLYVSEGFPATTLRLFLAYGPGQDTRRLVPYLIENCLKKKSFPVSKGEQIRDFCFIEDIIEAIFLTFESKEAEGEVINIASGNPITVRELIEKIRDLVGEGTPMYGETPYRPGENMELFADISKAKKILDWTANQSLEIGLKRTIEWVQKKI